ncbi:EpsG family protein [Planomicrobium okeanokoites]|uniref:EpsG family protein n=1 Tax=Planomicrobium okeanokoites TaxID=244 RepID=UPI0009FBFCD1|nr:EpsG family protein [Planomicrobium okeanokoites]
MESVTWDWSSLFLYTFLILSTSFLVAKSQQVAAYTDVLGNYKVKVKVSKFLIIISIIIPIGIGGSRYAVASDYFSYISMYNEIASMGLLKSLEIGRSEPAFVLLLSLIHTIFNNPQVIFFISSLVAVGFVYSAVLFNKEHVKMGIAIFIFLISYYFWTWTAVRMSIAVGIVFYSYKYLIDKNVIKYIVTVLFAALFHYTAVIVLPLYFYINGPKKNKKVKNLLFYSILLISIVFFGVYYNAIFAETKYGAYQESIGNIFGGINQIIIRIPIALVLFFYYKKLVKHNLKNFTYIKIYLVGFILNTLTLWNGIFGRLVNYFFIVEILLIASIFTLKAHRERGLVIYLILTYYFILFVYTLISNDRLMPYTNYWGINI